jgi:prepilin-type N-terminal cleavage/methylation domain-containing protein
MNTPNATRPRAGRPGFTLVEAMVTIAIIAALVGVLLPALSILRRNGLLATSQSNMRTIGALMTAYSLDNKDHVVPSQFDYRNADGTVRPGAVRTASPAGSSPPIGPAGRGTWSDILWTVGKFGPLQPTESDRSPSPMWDYRFDSPDTYAYLVEGTVSKNTFRSEVELQRAMPTDTASEALPFGPGASIREQGQPGYFAANDFFNSIGGSEGGRWYTNAMVRMPSQSLYLVDSRAGETIDPPLGWNEITRDWADAESKKRWAPIRNNVAPDDPDHPRQRCEVEFRYVGDLCLILYLDAHVGTMAKWADPKELPNERQVRIDRLDKRP